MIKLAHGHSRLAAPSLKFKVEQTVTAVCQRQLEDHIQTQSLVGEFDVKFLCCHYRLIEEPTGNVRYTLLNE